MNRPLITADDVRADPHLEIPLGAIVTPLARDLLRRQGRSHTPNAPDTTRARWVIANWKSHKTLAEADAFARALSLPNTTTHAAVCPPFTALHPLRQALPPHVALGAQDLSPHGEGAHTGEVAARHLTDVGCTLALVGHSERRAAGETDALIRRKLLAALAADLQPVLCIGETRAERDAQRTHAILSRQLRAALDPLEPTAYARLIVAYEPRWAIGTGHTPTPTDIEDALAHTRTTLRRLDPASATTPILYGGSVSPSNASALLHLPGCDGALVGGASLDPQRFAQIVAAS